MTVLRRSVVHWGRSWTATAVLTLASVGSSPAFTVPEAGHIHFDVIRAGEKIGEHRIGFHRTGDLLRVETEVDVRVDVLFFTAYEFHQRSTEIWRNGRLERLVSETHRDGKDYTLSVVAIDAHTMEVVLNGRMRIIPRRDYVPTSLWNSDAVSKAELISSITGEIMPLKVNPRGEETGSASQLVSYHLDAQPDFSRTIWFDDEGALVRVELTGDDGSLVRLESQ